MDCARAFHGQSVEYFLHKTATMQVACDCTTGTFVCNWNTNLTPSLELAAKRYKRDTLPSSDM